MVDVGQVEAVADALESHLALNVAIADAFPVNNVPVRAGTLQIGPIGVLVVYQVDATLSTYDEILHFRTDKIC